jgi:peroxiredoxin
MTESELIKFGGVAPDFSLPNAVGATVQLYHILKEHNVILYFMREFRWLQCREFARQLAGASKDFTEHNTQLLIIGPGEQAAAYATAHSVGADPASVLFDETGAVYDTYLLDKQFFSLIQQTAAFIIAPGGSIRFALKVTNMFRWLDTSVFKDLLTNLDTLTGTQ